MKCPYCGCEATKVIDSRTKKGTMSGSFFSVEIRNQYKDLDDYRIRRHRCFGCYDTFLTIETYMEE